MTSNSNSASGSPLPEGAAAVGLGTVVSGLAAYAFLILSARALGPARDASLSALWTLAFLVGPGCFSPLEREISREVAGRIAHGVGARQAVVRCAQVGAVLACVLLVAAGGAAPYLTHRVFDDHSLLMVDLVLAVLGYYVMHLSWGALAGARHFTGYSVVTGMEGLFRLLVCIGLVVVGSHNASSYGIGIAVAPFVAAVVGWRTQPPELLAGPQAPLRRTAAAITLLLGSSFFSQFVLLIGPLAVKLLSGTKDQTQAGRFLAGMTLVRIPLFLSNALMAALLPKLAEFSRNGRRHEFQKVLLRLTGLVVVVGLLSTAFATTLGPFFLRALFGAGYSLPGLDLGALSLAACAYLTATLFSFALIALESHGRTTVSWAISVAAFVLVIAALRGNNVTARVELGFMASCLASVITMGAFLLRSLARHPWNRHLAMLDEPLVAPILNY